MIRTLLPCLFAILCIAIPARAQEPVTGILAGLRDQPLNPVLLRELKASIAAVPEAPQRCRLGVLYALGSLASGNLEEGLAARAALQKAFPDHDLLQELADARLSDPCGDCTQGTVTEPCAACGGTGRCPTCKGTGQQAVPGMGSEPRKVKCMRCTEAPGKCRACHGEKGFPKPCPACTGTGRLASPERANTLYTRMLLAMAPPKEEKRPVIQVVTAAPPAEAAPDPEAVTRGWVQKSLAAAQVQAADSPLLQKYGIQAEDVRRVRDPELSEAAHEEALKALRARGLPHARGHYFALPFPAGLRYCVADVKRNPYGGHFLKLTSTPPARNPPAQPLTPREALAETARGICEPLGDFLADPTVCVPDSDAKSAALRKGEMIESGAWFIPVLVSRWGTVERDGTCYRTADELMTQMGLAR